MLRSNLSLFVRNRDTSTRPGQVSNPVGSVVLGFIQPDGSGGENLDIGQLIELKYMFEFRLSQGHVTLLIDNPLAQGFQLDDGQVTFTVPSVPTKNNYIVARAYLMLLARSSVRFLLYSHRAVIGDSGNISPQFTINGS